GDLAFEHKIDRLTPVRVPRGPRAGREVHHELYHFGLQGGIRDVEPRLRDNPALCGTAGIETENASRARGRRDRDGQNPPPRIVGAVGPACAVQGAVGCGGEAFSSWGSWRLLAICPFSLRPPPRTPGQ